ncbi:MAG: hypothetical protein IH804_07935 [Planctomycetes bacterium]|nr:hypothetical protein [Planctomycetota bacterium]
MVGPDDLAAADLLGDDRGLEQEARLEEPGRGSHVVHAQHDRLGQNHPPGAHGLGMVLRRRGPSGGPGIGLAAVPEDHARRVGLQGRGDQRRQVAPIDEQDGLGGHDDSEIG